MISNVAAERMGVYTREADVPPAWRLPALASRFTDRDVWAEYSEAVDFTEWQQKCDATTERAWKAHMEERGRHHAFPTVEDVDLFLAERMASITMERTYRVYWMYLRRFFEWLTWRTDYPHRYNPVLMACVEGKAGQEMWSYFIETVKGEMLEAKEEGTLE